jgi:hypothetical protein
MKTAIHSEMLTNLYQATRRHIITDIAMRISSIMFVSHVKQLVSYESSHLFMVSCAFFIVTDPDLSAGLLQSQRLSRPGLANLIHLDGQI